MISNPKKQNGKISADECLLFVGYINYPGQIDFK